MTARLPDWPRLLGVRMAAVYAGVSVSGFKAAVGRVWPEPIRVGKRVLWDRRDLDAVCQRLEEERESAVNQRKDYPQLYSAEMPVYFMQCQNTGQIKIGISYTPEKRRKDISRKEGRKIKILGITSGGMEKERELHKRFADYRLQGEWFKPVPEILAVVYSETKIKRDGEEET